MPLWKRLGFLLVFVVPALMPAAHALGVATGMHDVAAWFPLFVLFVLVPVLDRALGHDPSNPADARIADDRWFAAPTLLAVPVQLGLLAWSADLFAHDPFGPLGELGWLLSHGVVGGVLAINTAHELVHKDTRVERAAGGVLLASVGYHGFKIEHVRGHHVHVSTPLDASSARYGESLWHFLPRALVRNTANAWRLEVARLRRAGHSVLSPRNEMLGWTFRWLAFALGALLIGGGRGLAFFLAQGLFAACSLEIINYIEHYGLERRRLPDGRYERTTHLHSWNSDFLLSNLLLYQLQRHSDHHETPRRRYQALLHHADSPQLPGGYASMFVLALCPPLWYRTIHPVLATWRDTLASQGNRGCTATRDAGSASRA
jgi:alkane 1-monooxygenase